MNLEEQLVKNYRKVFWIKNYVKTITATTLVSSGIGLIITGNVTYGHHQLGGEVELIMGAVCIILALIITYVFDKWAAQKNKKMINDIDDYIEKKAIEIAEEKILNAMENFEK